MTNTPNPEPFRAQLQLRWGDSDQLGHVNNVMYLEYAQEARLRYLYERMATVGGEFGPVVVRRIEISFDRSLQYSTDGIEVAVWPVRIGTSSFTLRHRIRDAAGIVYSTIDAVVVAVDLESETSRPLPEDVRAVIEADLVTDTAEVGV